MVHFLLQVMQQTALPLPRLSSTAWFLFTAAVCRWYSAGSCCASRSTATGLLAFCPERRNNTSACSFTTPNKLSTAITAKYLGALHSLMLFPTGVFVTYLLRKLHSWEVRRGISATMLPWRSIQHAYPNASVLKHNSTFLLHPLRVSILLR